MKRKKCIEIHYRACQDTVGDGSVKLEYCLIIEMMADKLTKTLGPQFLVIMKDLISMMVSFDENM